MFWKMHCALLVMGLCFMFAPTALAQKKEEGKGDPTAPGDEHKKLEALAGKWDVTVAFVIGEGKEGKGTATCEAKMALDGRFLHQRYDSVFMGRALLVEQYLGFDRHKGKFVELHMNSMDTGIMLNEGELSKDGKSITCAGKKLDETTGKEGRIRTVWSISDKDNFTIEWFITGSDGKEAKAVTLAHKRKK